MKRTPQPPVPRTLGPVANLEHHLPPEWWRSLFGAVYLQTDGDVVEDAHMTRAEVDDIISALELSGQERILDLCCGQGRHTLELARRGYTEVVGVDRSRYLIRLARRRARQHGLSARFHEGDARRIGSRRDRFEVVLLLGNSFGYFDKLEDDLRVLRGAIRVLEPRGRLFLDVADGTWIRANYQPRSWEWIDRTQFVCRERSLSADRTRLISREVVVHSEKGVLVDQFYAERLYEPDQLAGLLEEAGFTQVQAVGSVETTSQRNQDLGMMERRIRLVARTPARRTPRPEGTTTPLCAVLLGDPRLPDSVKLRGEFSPEDIQTIARLKEALISNEKLTFEFIDDHSSMINVLKQRQPSFVFNLCDEGWRNDATMELHVPAVLDTLGIPYTGAEPACLAICFDKQIVRSLAADLEIPVPFETSIAPGDSSGTIPAVFPALMKPARGDSSVGITAASLVNDPNQAVRAHSQLSEQFPGVPILVQEFLSGTEYSVGIVGNPGLGYRILPVLQVDYSELPGELPPILGYESKWDPESPYWTKIKYVRAPDESEVIADMVAHSLKLFERLGCRDYARFDFRADASGVVKLLEVNPNPGWCWDGKLNLMAGFENSSYGDLLGWILDAATQRMNIATR